METMDLNEALDAYEDGQIDEETLERLHPGVFDFEAAEDEEEDDD